MILSAAALDALFSNGEEATPAKHLMGTRVTPAAVAATENRNGSHRAGRLEEGGTRLGGQALPAHVLPSTRSITQHPRT